MPIVVLYFRTMVRNTLFFCECQCLLTKPKIEIEQFSWIITIIRYTEMRNDYTFHYYSVPSRNVKRGWWNTERQFRYFYRNLSDNTLVLKWHFENSLWWMQCTEMDESNGERKLWIPEKSKNKLRNVDCCMRILLWLIYSLVWNDIDDPNWYPDCYKIDIKSTEYLY